MTTQPDPVSGAVNGWQGRLLLREVKKRRDITQASVGNTGYSSFGTSQASEVVCSKIARPFRFPILGRVHWLGNDQGQQEFHRGIAT